MANRLEHEIIGAITGGAFAALNKDDANKYAVNMATGAALGKYAARLPDILEPALHPNHRKFFHSWLFLGAVGTGMYQLYQWNPEEGHKKVFKWGLMIAGAAYASHLLRDSLTPKGLPLI